MLTLIALNFLLHILDGELKFEGLLAETYVERKLGKDQKDINRDPLIPHD